MTSDAEIESVMFTKSVIKSSAALSYVEAQARMDDRYAILFVLNVVLFPDHNLLPSGQILSMSYFILIWRCPHISNFLVVYQT